MRIFKIFLINFIILICVLFFLNFILEKYSDNINNFINNHFDTRIVSTNFEPKIEKHIEQYPENFKRLELTDDSFNEFCGEKRIELGAEYEDKKPIVTLGCSYMYGHGLKKEESFPYTLSNLTKRRVYNYAICGEELIQSYTHLIGYNNEIIKNAEYFIYLYMHDHINRYLQISNFIDIYDDLNLNKSCLLDKIYIIKYIKQCIKFRNTVNKYPDPEEGEKFLKNLIRKYFNKIKKINPNAKFIIIVYDEKISQDRWDIYRDSILNSSIWQELDTEPDITVVQTKDIMGFYFDKNYKLEADIVDWHPNAKVWQEFTPKFVKKYNL